MDTIEMQITMTADISITDEDLKDNLEMTVKELIILKIVETIDHHHIEWFVRRARYVKLGWGYLRLNQVLFFLLDFYEYNK